MRILYYTDPHITKYMSQHDAAWQDAQTASIHYFTQLACDYQADLMVCGGDLLENSNIMGKNLSLLLNYFKTLENAEIGGKKIPYVSLIGNHEMYSTSNRTSPLSLFSTDQAKFVDFLEVRDKLGFLSFSDTYDMPEINDKLKDCQIVFTHLAFNGLVTNSSGYTLKTGLFPQDFTHSGYLINGDVHSYNVMQVREDLALICPGACQSTKVGELYPNDFPSFFMIDLDDSGKKPPAFSVLPNYEAFLQVVATSQQDLEEKIEKFKQFKKVIFRYIYQEESDHHFLETFKMPENVAGLTLQRVSRKVDLSLSSPSKVFTGVNMKEVIHTLIDDLDIPDFKKEVGKTLSEEGTK